MTIHPYAPSTSVLRSAVRHFPYGASLYRTPDSLSGEALLNQLRAAFPGQHLYLDFWATWCGPCRQEMPASAQLHAAAEGLPVTFVYLCTESGSSEKQWERSIAEFSVPGTHLYVGEETHAALMQLFDARGYPTYLMLHPDGEVDRTVERPSGLDRGKLERLIR